MRLLDVNVLVNALRPEVAHHAAAFDFLALARLHPDPVVILPEVAAGFMRIVTRQGIFEDPEDAETAMSALDAWCTGPGIRIREAGPGRWRRFRMLVDDFGLVGSDVHDGLLAAACLDLDAELVTFDRGFARFPNLRVVLL